MEHRWHELAIAMMVLIYGHSIFLKIYFAEFREVQGWKKIVTIVFPLAKFRFKEGCGSSLQFHYLAAVLLGVVLFYSGLKVTSVL